MMWLNLQEGESSLEECACPLSSSSGPASQCISGAFSDLPYQRAYTLSATCTLYPTVAQWSEPTYEPQAGLLWAALLSEAERTKSVRRRGGNSRRTHYSPLAMCRSPSAVHPSSRFSPPASLPASSFTHTHFFLFLNISASFLFPPPLAQCNYGNGFPPTLLMAFRHPVQKLG